MNALDVLITYLDPTPVYNEAFAVADNFLFISGALLFLAILFRAVKEQFNAVTGKGFDLGAFVMDVFLWGSILVSYYFLMGLFVTLFNAIIAWLSVNGSLQTIALEIEHLTQTFANLKTAEESEGALAKAIDLVSEGFGYMAYGAAYLSYIITFMIVLATSSFLHLAHAFLFAIAIFWGLLVIPLQITNHIRLMRPFGLVLGILLMWPVFELVIMYFFKFLFVNGAAAMINTVGKTYSIGDEATFYLAFSVMNCVIFAIVLSAPFFTMAMIQGTGLPGAIGSFGLAGIGAAMAISKSIAGPMSNISRGGGGLYNDARHLFGDKNNGGASPTNNFKGGMDKINQSFKNTSMFDAINKMQSDMTNLSDTATSNKQHTNHTASDSVSDYAGNSQADNHDQANNLGGDVPTVEGSHAKANSGKGKKAAQAKRGAIINQNKKLGGLG